MTGAGVVNLLITDLAVFRMDRPGMTLIELAAGTTIEEVAGKTEPMFSVELVRK